MKNILIVTHANDLHAQAVEWALKKKGHIPHLWIISDFPTLQCISVGISSDQGSQVTISGPEIECINTSFDSVWLRRLFPATASKELHPADQAYAAKEYAAYVENIISLVAPDAFWVNSRIAQQRSCQKLLQLNVARKIGLSIPDTVVTNSESELLNFHNKHKGEIVCKSFRPTVWKCENGFANFLTAKVTREILQNSFAIRNSVGIYQQFVQKEYEIRVTIVGERIFAVKLVTPDKVDWRWRQDLMSLETITIPKHISEKCLEMMRILGVEFGAFDFAVDHAGQYVLFEINEMGQFLWIEERCHGIHLLDAFAELLINGRNAPPEASQKTLFSDYLASPQYAFDTTSRAALHSIVESGIVIDEGRFK